MSQYTPASVLEDEALVNSFNWSRESLLDFGDFMKTEALSAKLPIAIAIFESGQRIYQVGLPGSTTDNDLWIQRKVNTVLATNHATLHIRAQIDGEIRELLGIKDHLGDLALCGGGIPIFENGEVKAILIFSGLTQYEDHKFIMDAFKKWSNK